MSFSPRVQQRNPAELTPAEIARQDSIDFIAGRSLQYEDVEAIADYIRAHSGHKYKPTIGIILGSGYAGLADGITDNVDIPYTSIPHFCPSTVPGHRGLLTLGYFGGKCVVCMQGRFHPYEGHSLAESALPVRVMRLLGVETLVVTNAAGGLNQAFKPGDLMILKDHIFLPGFTGTNPLRGPNDPRWGTRFPAMNRAYDRQFREIAFKVAEGLGIDRVVEGVYAMSGGPTFETATEARFLRTIGADAVGMSTAHEVITARHCGMNSFGLSLISNLCSIQVDDDIVTTHEEVMETGKLRGGDALRLIEGVVEAM